MPAEKIGPQLMYSQFARGEFQCSVNVAGSHAANCEMRNGKMSTGAQFRQGIVSSLSDGKQMIPRLAAECRVEQLIEIGEGGIAGAHIELQDAALWRNAVHRKAGRSRELGALAKGRGEGRHLHQLVREEYRG